jgi:hypothetical protein
MGSELRGPFAEAVHVATDLVSRREVTDAWARESACADMSVGALARHVVSQWFNAVRLLRAPAGSDPMMEIVVRALSRPQRAPASVSAFCG